MDQPTKADDVEQGSGSAQGERACTDEEHAEAERPAYATINPSAMQIEMEIDPPPSRLELGRDAWLRFLGGPIHFWIGMIVLLLVIVDGAFFFFLLIGAHRMCRPRTDCEPRNWWYNWSIQFLNVLFTYLASISLPWRLSNAMHLFRSKRPSKAGLDLYGRATVEEIWYHLPQRKRRWIVACLTANSLTQYANQATRIVYYNYELQAAPPGSIWTNVFFVASMGFAAVGGFCQLREEIKLRRGHPERFPPHPLHIAAKYLRRVVCREKADGEDAEDGDAEDPRPLPDREESERRRCLRGLRKWLKNDQTSLDLWGL
ncbi:hypothetical protein ACHAXT_005103 [Thalassiosira profunda]